MNINAWKTNFIGLNKPSKVLSGVAESFVSQSLWPYANGADDPYWSGGVNPQFYRWRVTFTVNERLHGSHLTRTPFRFDAQDIEVGDFVAGALDGKVLQIMSIISKTNSEVVAVVEDRLRYNTFRDPGGFGLFTTPGPVIFFQINELGYPMLDPVPGEAATDFADNVLSRFQYLNPLINYLLEQDNNGFEQGDTVCIQDGDFVLSNSGNVDKFIGTVVHPGPGPHQFILRPANGVIDFVPSLPGEVGDYIYPSVDGSGDLTTSDLSRRPIFMKVADAITSSTTGTGVNPAGISGDIIEFNRLAMPLTGDGVSYDLDYAIQVINSNTVYHKITAVKVGAATSVTSDIDNLGSSYGIVAGYAPFSAEINGVLVTFTTTTNGSAAYGDLAVADVNDMVLDINNTGITDIVASVTDGSKLTITNTAGAGITVSNISTDANGNNFAGAGSLSSLVLTTAANTVDSALRLERLDGGPITIRDIQGGFLEACGVMSGQTGRFALGLNIEQGLRSSKTTVVANIMARDALLPIVGDQAYVLDAGAGEWALFLYDGSVWNRAGNQRSESTDARTLFTEIDIAELSTGVNTVTLGSISTGRKVISVSIAVTEASIGTVAQLGTITESGLLMQTRDNNLTAQGEYIASTNYFTTGLTGIVLAVTKVEADTGKFSVTLTYV